MIETRQAGQDLLAGDFAGIRAVVAAKGDVKTLENPAKAMARWMRQFPTLFPQGQRDKATTPGRCRRSGPTPPASRRSPTRWRMRPTKMAELAKAGDADGVAAQVKAVGDGCGACHRTYRAR